MISEPKNRESAVCSCCGQTVEKSAGKAVADDTVILCDRCYLSALAPDHKAQRMESFD